MTILDWSQIVSVERLRQWLETKQPKQAVGIRQDNEGQCPISRLVAELSEGTYYAHVNRCEAWIYSTDDPDWVLKVNLPTPLTRFVDRIDWNGSFEDPVTADEAILALQQAREGE